MNFAPPPPELPDIKKRMIAPTFLWIAMFASTFMYLFVLSNLSKTSLNTELKILTSEEPLVKLFSLVSVVMALAAWQMPMIIRKLAPKNADPFPSWFVSLIVRFAMIESISLFGFVLAMKAQDINLAIPFFIVTWAGFLLSFPTVDKATRPLT